MYNVNSNSESTLKNIQKTSTIEKFIEKSNSIPLDYQKLSYIEQVDNIKFPISNIVCDYLKELKSLAVVITLDATNLAKYKYKPKLLASDIYNNPELYYIILLLNGMADVREFDRDTILMLSKSDMAECLSNIYNAERLAIDSYNNR